MSPLRFLGGVLFSLRSKQMSGDDLFSMASERQKASFEPLAVRMRPQTLDEIYGQEQIVGAGTFLRAMIERDTIPSLLLYGPSGVGKTTFGSRHCLRNNSRFVRLNAVTAGTAGSCGRSFRKRRTPCTCISGGRFYSSTKSIASTRGQQDVLLPYVEDGTVILVGATTENPYFEVNRPLLSRLRVVPCRPCRKKPLPPCCVVPWGYGKRAGSSSSRCVGRSPAYDCPPGRLRRPRRG